jgi:hypothetical protein
MFSDPGLPGSLHFAARRAKKQRGRRSRAAPVGMTEKENPIARALRLRSGRAGVPVFRVMGFEFGNMGQDGLVRGRRFVMIWTFLVSRGYSAADCL